jgi:hypothetical protein
VKEKTTISIHVESVAKAKQLTPWGEPIGDIYEKALDAYIGISRKIIKPDRRVHKNGRKPETNTTE